MVDTTNKLLQFAQEQQIEGMSAARATLHREGRLEVAQGRGVEEIKKEQPWINHIFGPGAKLSGAMQEAEETAVIEYVRQMKDGMDDFRKMTPEVFRNEQTALMDTLLTGDAETDTRIRYTTTKALEEGVRLHAKSHEGYIQERHLLSFNERATAALNLFDDDDDESDMTANMEFLGSALAKRDGMDDAAYKQALYNFAAVEAESGREFVKQYLEMQGMVDNDEDLANLVKVESTAAGARAEKDSIRIGALWTNLKEKARDTEYPIAVLLAEMDALKTEHPSAMSAAKTQEILEARAAAETKKMSDKDRGDFWEKYQQGQGFAGVAPSGVKQEVLNQATQQMRDSGDPNVARIVMENHEAAGVVDKDWQRRMSGSLATSIDMIDGVPTLKDDQITTLQEMLMMDQTTPTMLRKMLNEDEAQMFLDFKYALKSNPGMSYADALVETQRQAKIPHEYKPLSQEQQKIVEERISDLSQEDLSGIIGRVFGTSESFDMPYIRAELKNYMRTTMRRNGGDVEKALEAAKVRFNKNNMRIGNQFIPLGEGTALHERMGIAPNEVEAAVSTALRSQDLEIDDVHLRYDPYSGALAFNHKDKPWETQWINHAEAGELFKEERQVQIDNEATELNVKKAAEVRAETERVARLALEPLLQQKFAERHPAEQMLGYESYASSYMRMLDDQSINAAASKFIAEGNDPRTYLQTKRDKALNDPELEGTVFGAGWRFLETIKDYTAERGKK